MSLVNKNIPKKIIYYIIGIYMGAICIEAHFYFFQFLKNCQEDENDE